MRCSCTLFAAAVVFATIERRRRRRRRHGGSVIGKRANRDIGRTAAGERLEADYFKCANCVEGVATAGGDVRPTFSEPEFERRCVNSVGLGDRRGCDECKELLESEQWLAL
jgi:hypothetical protein